LENSTFCKCRLLAKMKNTDSLNKVNEKRRSLLGRLVAGSGLLTLAGLSKAEEQSDDDADSLRFPGDPVDNKVVYQFNQGDQDYHDHVLFSVGAVLRHYGDNVNIIVSCFGPGVHILGKKPTRPVSDITKQRVSSLSQYGVEFHACGQTMKALKWTKKDLLPFASVVDVGAVDLIELQAKGYSYVAW